MKNEPKLRVATWNVHRTVGGDGRADADRIERVIASDIARNGPQVLALQEADSNDPPHPALLSTDRIERETGLQSVHGPDLMRWGPQSGGFLGNIMFIERTIEITDRTIIALPGRCPRAAILVEALVNGIAVRLVSCHLSLSQALRAMQLRLIGQVIDRRKAMQTIILGDLNEWRPWGGLGLSRRVTGLDLHGPTVATFPARRPVLPLDRVLSIKGAVRNAARLDSPELRFASDHLPLCARVVIRGESA